MAKITKTFVDKVAAPAEGYEVHWDDSVKGYGVRVSSQGKKVFMVMGRVAGKSIQFTLGPYGTLTEAKARERAQKVLQDMREGIDPRAATKAEAAMKVTLQEVLDGYVERPGKLKDSTAAEYRRLIEVAFAKWAPLPIASITRDMVKDRHAVLVKGGADGKESPWVFPTRSKTGHIRDARASMEAVGKIVGKKLSLHDCRRSFSNYALRECQIEKFRLDLLTGHQPSTADVTARAYLDLTNLQWLQPDVQKVGDWIEQQAAIAASKNVVQLQRTA